CLSLFTKRTFGLVNIVILEAYALKFVELLVFVVPNQFPSVATTRQFFVKLNVLYPVYEANTTWLVNMNKVTKRRLTFFTTFLFFIIFILPTKYKEPFEKNDSDN